jgi:hypothetical protein
MEGKAGGREERGKRKEQLVGGGTGHTSLFKKKEEKFPVAHGYKLSEP